MDEPAGTTKVQLWTRAAAVYKFIAEASDMQLLGPNHKEANWRCGQPDYLWLA